MDSRTRAKSKDLSTVTVSLPGALNARGEDVRLLVKSLRFYEKQTSMKQEPNNIQGLCPECIGFGKRYCVGIVGI